MALKVVDRLKGVWAGLTLTAKDAQGKTFVVTNPSDLYGSRSADSIPAAYSAVSQVSEALASMPFEVKDSGIDRTLEQVLNNPMRGNYDRHAVWGLLYQEWVANGEAYAIIHRNRLMRDVDMIEPAFPYAENVYQGVFTNKRVDNATAQNVIALRGTGFNGKMSTSPIKTVAKNALEMMRVAQNLSVDSLKDNKSGKFFVSLPTTLAEGGAQASTIDQMVKDLEAHINEVQTKNKDYIPALHPGAQLESMGKLTPVDLELIKIFDFGIDDIARAYVVPPHRIAGAANAKPPFAKLEQDNEHFYSFSLSWRISRITDAIANSFFGGNPLEGTIIMDSIKGRQGSPFERAQVAELLVTRGGLITINEGRERLGYPPIEGGNKLLEPKGAPPQGGNETRQQREEREETEE